MIIGKMTNHFEHAEKHNSNITMFSIFETIFMVAILIGQSMYLKKLIKRI